jgi:hypothetical protein
MSRKEEQAESLPLSAVPYAPGRLRSKELDRLDVLSSSLHSIEKFPFVSPPKTDELRQLKHTPLPAQFL